MDAPTTRFDFTAPLWNPGTSQTIGYAEQVADRQQGNKKQGTINAELLAAVAQAQQTAQDAYELACAAL